MRTGPNGERLGMGERLVVARERRELRQIDAAREIGVCRETVARIEVDHIPSEATRSKVLLWLEAQEAAADAANAGAAKAERAARRAGARQRRAAAKRIDGVRGRVRARLEVRRRAQKAFREGRKFKK